MTRPTSSLSSMATSAAPGNTTSLMRSWRSRNRPRPARLWLTWGLGVAATSVDLLVIGLGIYVVAFVQFPTPVLSWPARPDFVTQGLAAASMRLAHEACLGGGYAALALAWFFANLHLLVTIAQPGRADRSSAAVRLAGFAIKLGAALVAAGILLAGIRTVAVRGFFWDWNLDQTVALATLLCCLVWLRLEYVGVGAFGLAIGAVCCFAEAAVACWASQGLHRDNLLWLAEAAAINLAVVVHASLRRLRAMR